jgi:type II secretory pathway component PulK
LPEIATLFNLHKFNLKELVKQFRKRRAIKRLREKQFNTLLLKAIIEEKFYKDSINKGHFTLAY